MSKKTLKIEHMSELVLLMESLVRSGYDLHITPVYDIPSHEKDRAKRMEDYTARPRLKHYTVEIGDMYGCVIDPDAVECNKGE